MLLLILKGHFRIAVKLGFPKYAYNSVRAVVSGGAGGTLAPPEFGSSVNPIPTKGGRLCPPHYCYSHHSIIRPVQ